MVAAPKPTNVAAEVPQEPTQQTQRRPNGAYFLAFLNTTGARGEELKTLIAATNNLEDFREQIGSGFPRGLKTAHVVHCVLGDANDILINFANEHASVRHGRSHWFMLKKSDVADYVAKLTSSANYKVTTEKKAKA